MQTFITLFSLISLALFASASPVEKRAGRTLCAAAPNYSRAISINVRYPDHSYKEAFFGLEAGSNVLVSKASDGTAFTNETVTKFDFYECKSTYLGTQYDGNYGLLKPKGDSSNCVQTQTGTVTAANQGMIVAPCSQAEDQSQLQETFEYNNGFLTFTSTAKTQNAEQHPTFFRLGTGAKGGLRLLAGNPRPPAFEPTDTGDYTGLSYIG